MNKYLALISAVTLSLFQCLPSTARENAGIDFVANQRQWAEPVQYKADVRGGSVFLTSRGFMYNYYSQKDLDRIHELQHHQNDVSGEPVHGHAYEVRFAGARPDLSLSAEDRQSHYHNYFLGKDPAHWAGKVPVFRQVSYHNVYDGIDAKVYSQGQSMKYDFVVAPGADASAIALQFDGVKPVLTAGGDLQLKTSVNTITEQAPYAYQVIGGLRKQVPCRYELEDDGLVTFAFPGGYDQTQTLVIDPVLVFGTYSGGTGNTWGFSATYDLDGSLFAGGECFNAGWPTTVGAYQTVFGNGVDAGINKYNSAGTALVYSTYYGGTGTDLPNNMVVNSFGQLILCGTTSSLNLPVTAGCFDDTANGNNDIFVARFSVDGSALLAATYVGGGGNDGSNNTALSPNYGDQNRGEVFADSLGNIYVSSSTQSADFPTTAGAYQAAYGGGGQDGCVFKLDSACTALQFSTFLGGTNLDAAFALVVKSNGDIVVVGGTRSNDFPTTAGSLFPAFQGATDAFVSILSASGAALLQSSYLGTATYDHAFKVQLDPANNVYICGQSDGNYPVSAGVFSMPNGSIFVDKLSPDLSTSLLSTRLGNATPNRLVPTAFLYDRCGNIYLCGFQAQPNLPVSVNAIQANAGGFWLCVLTPGMATLAYATYYGAGGDHVDGGTSRFDPQGIVYHSVCNFGNFPTTPTAWQPNDITNSFDVASFKINFEAMGVIAGIALGASNDSACAPASIQFTNSSSSATAYEWHFGDNTGIDTAKNPLHTFTSPGVYNVMLHARNPDLCVTDDTTYMTIYIFDVEKPLLALRDTLVCAPGPITLTAPVSNLNANMAFHWEPANAITSDPNRQTITADGTIANTFTVTVTDSIGNICKESSTDSLRVLVFDASQFKAFGDTVICPGDTAFLYAEGGDSYAWVPNHKIEPLNAPNVFVYPGSTTTYTVTISNELGCVEDRKVTVTVKPILRPDAGEDQDMKSGDFVYLTASGGVSYRWYPVVNLAPADQPIVRVNPPATMTYFVEITSAEGCKAIDSVTVRVMNAYIPNAFSPNGDGLNDEFRVRVTNPSVKVVSLSVYDRWGNRVFSANHAGKGWDGTYQGEPVQNGTYYFLFDYNIGSKQFHEKGDLTVVR